ncbi:MAG TPA: MlaD family protein [Solirubrobacteraceae bacterium]|nr:MlaD family protein [Solirubrobacteraceae bacterium]
MKRRRRPFPALVSGIIGVVLLALITYLVFGGRGPFKGSPFVLKAMFTTQIQLHIPSDVRMAGVNVGKIVSIERLPNAGSSQVAVVTMNINSNGLPIHADATVQLKPKLFLEGNFYADLRPGSPSAPVVSSGFLMPLAQTSSTVQIDRVLAALQGNARSELQTLLQGIGSSLQAPPGPGEDATQDPIVQGLTGAQSLNLALKYSTAAFRDSAIVNQALLGIQPHDLEKVVQGNQKLLQGLADSGQQLPGFVTTFNATLGALAARQQALSDTIAALPPWLKATNDAIGPLEASYVPTQQLARALLPGVQQLGPTIKVGIPFLQQSTLLFSKPELGNLLADLTPAIQHTGISLNSTRQLLVQADLFARCFSHNIVPTGNQLLQDPPNTTGLPLYQEVFQGAVGLASSSQNFDGNGRYTRALAGGGANRIATSPLPTGGPLFGNAVNPPLGTRPAFPGKAPPLRRDVPCYQNPAPDLNRVVTGGTP